MGGGIAEPIVRESYTTAGTLVKGEIDRISAGIVCAGFGRESLVTVTLAPSFTSDAVKVTFMADAKVVDEVTLSAVRPAASVVMDVSCEPDVTLDAYRVHGTARYVLQEVVLEEDGPRDLPLP